MLRKCLFVSAGLLALGILAISIFTFLIFDDKDRCWIMAVVIMTKHSNVNKSEQQ